MTGVQTCALPIYAHLAKDVGADFDTAREMALEAGFRHIALYEKRKPILICIDE